MLTTFESVRQIALDKLEVWESLMEALHDFPEDEELIAFRNEIAHDVKCAREFLEELADVA